MSATREWTHVDKSTWGPGAWQSEPDKIQWVDPATDLDCLMVRHETSGHWCGYVGVAAGHPFFEVSYSSCVEATEGHFYCEDTPDSRVEVHGGLTFADACREDSEEGHGVCHIPEPGRPDHVWWFGFDCHHGYDLAPGHKARDRDFAARDPEYAALTARIEANGPQETYRDRAYVESEVGRLAAQLAAAA